MKKKKVLMAIGISLGLILLITLVAVLIINIING